MIYWKLFSLLSSSCDSIIIMWTWSSPSCLRSTIPAERYDPGFFLATSFLLIYPPKNQMIDNHMTIKVKIVLVKSTRLKRLGAMMIPFCRNRWTGSSNIQTIDNHMMIEFKTYVETRTQCSLGIVERGYEGDDQLIITWW